MSVIKFTIICGYLLSGVLIQGISDDSLSYDLERMVTLRGQTFQDILILDADQHGLLFRHREGIAKLSFPELSAGLRGMYQPADDVQMPDEKATDSEGSVQENSPVDVRIDWVIRNRIYLEPVKCQRCIPVSLMWPQYHLSHHWLNPYYRSAVLEDFLYTSGLLPLPPGVNIVHLPSPTPWNF